MNYHPVRPRVAAAVAKPAGLLVDRAALALWVCGTGWVAGMWWRGNPDPTVLGAVAVVAVSALMIGCALAQRPPTPKQPPQQPKEKK